MKAPKYKHQITNGGFTIFFAMLVGSLALAVGAAIYDIAVRELDLSQTATQSQYAIYAADTGVECALYWDLKCELGACTTLGAANSAFATSSQFTVPGSGVMCNGIDIVQAWTVDADNDSATTTFKITFGLQPYCTLVTVEKYGSPTLTTVTSHGFNTACPQAGVIPSVTRLERVLQVDY